MFFLVACDDKDDNGKSREQKDNEYVNNWIYNNMSLYYYWNEDIPDEKKVDKAQSPDKFFESILYKYKQTGGDRFSWIQPSYVDLLNSLSGVSRDIGFEYNLVYLDEAKTTFAFCVLYPKKNADATSKGIKRGDLILKVDDVPVTLSNYTSVLSKGKSSYKLSVGDTQTGAVKDITVNVMIDYKEDPIYHTQVYEKGGKKIGYIIYNFFSPDNGESSDNIDSNDADGYKYDIALVKKIAEFKASGVKDVIIDLRYNSGGRVSSATNIASALVPQRSANEVFSYDEFNKGYQAYIVKEEGADALKNFFTEKIEVTNNKGTILSTTPIDPIDANIYIIATSYSASASELLINGIRAYIPVTHIGEKTVGKNVGSFSFYEPNDSRNKWGMQPICFKIFNAAGDSDNYADGFTPDVAVDEFQYEFKTLGDENEILLATAIAKITGGELPVQPKSAKQSLIIKGKSSLELKPESGQLLGDKNKYKPF